MYRLLLLVWLWVLAAPAPLLAQSSAQGLPPRPSPFQFVNDQAQLLSAGDAKKLEAGLRRYADNTGTQVVLVTVPSLGGRDVADYGRELGTAWGVGQRDKNNGVVVLLSKEERKVTVQAGSGVRDKITPELVSRVINQEMTPRFKQGNYFAGLRTGLSSIMLAANPDSRPQQSQDATAGTAAAGATAPADGLSSGAGSSALGNEPGTGPGYASEPAYAPASAPEPSGPGMGTLLVGALVVVGILWLLLRMFRRRSAASANAAPVPDFYGNGGGPGPGPGGSYGRGYQQPGPGYGPAPGGGMGSGMGGVLMTGAAAAAGAYLGNRMASSGHDHDSQGHNLGGADTPPSHLGGAAGAGGAGFGGGAGTGFPALNDEGSDYRSAPDYFSDDALNNSSNDYFSDSGSYDDLSSGDSGGGGFDGGDDNSGSW
ncbi:hypothetical protein GCM10023185_12870 [Hymenobacter saemangeumensis]|uniref:TPM domain-containing protein n=1 Tax=Hymenobacter saemangeumensis TaxID=1084522 RepID=A0ABP8I772_9BACT